MTHTPSIKKRRRRRRNEKWVRMQFARPLLEYYGRPPDDLRPVFMGHWTNDPRRFSVVKSPLSIRMPEGI